MPEWKIQIDGITPSRRADRGIGSEAQVQLGVFIDQTINPDQPRLNQVQNSQNQKRLIRSQPLLVFSDLKAQQPAQVQVSQNKINYVWSTYAWEGEGLLAQWTY